MRPSEDVQLLVRAVGKCYLDCSLCNWGEKIDQTYLKESLLDLVLDVLMGERFKPEVYFSCPDPLLHPSFPSLLSSTLERGLRSTVLIPSRTRSSRIAWEALTDANEIFVFSTSVNEAKNSGDLLRFLISNGSNVKLLFTTNVVREEALDEMIRFARNTGLELWLSPPLFRNSPGYEERIKGLEFSRRVRRWMGVYDVRVAFRGDFPVRFLEGPSCRPGCGLLHLTPEGTMGRCPFGTLEQALPSPLEAVALLRRGCSERGERFQLVPSIKLIAPGGKELYEDELELLSLLGELRSLSQAARALGVTPSSILKRIRRMERALGYPLTISSRGGSSRGGVLLTPECEELVREYRELKASLIKKINKYRFSS